MVGSWKVELSYGSTTCLPRSQVAVNMKNGSMFLFYFHYKKCLKCHKNVQKSVIKRQRILSALQESVSTAKF